MAFLRGLTVLRHLSHGNGQMVGTTVGRLQPLTTRKELLSFAERIKPHVPHSLTMYNNLVQHGRGDASHATFYTLRDDPDSHVVLWEWTYAPISQHVGVFCLEEEVDHLAEALAEAPFVRWNDYIAFNFFPHYFLRHLQRLAEDEGVKMKPYIQFAIVTYQPHLDTEPLRLYPGFRLCRLGTAGLRRVLEETRYTGDMPVAVMRGLAQKMPYLGVYMDAGVTQSTIVDVSSLSVAGEEEVPIAWAISTFFGAQGDAFTEPEYRGLGLRTITGLTLARMQVGFHGLIPYAVLYRDQNFIRDGERNGYRHTHDVFFMSGVSNVTD